MSCVESTTKAQLFCLEPHTQVLSSICNGEGIEAVVVVSVQKSRMTYGTSFDSQDSSGTCRSFRIAADHSCAPSISYLDSRDQERKDKLAIAGVLEQCTQMLQNSLLPAEQRTSSETSTFGAAAAAAFNVQKNEMIASLTASLVSRVSAEFQAKSGRMIDMAIRTCQQTIGERERQLASVREEVSRRMRDPMVAHLTEEKTKMQEAIKAWSRSSFQRKLEMHEVRMEVDTLRRVRRDACTSVHRLRDCQSKYDKICAENCALNRIMQRLQGAVRVVCHVPVRQNGSYLETTNRGEVTFTGEKKNRSYTLDDVLSGYANHQKMQRLLRPIATTVLDGKPPPSETGFIAEATPTDQVWMQH